MTSNDNDPVSFKEFNVLESASREEAALASILNTITLSSDVVESNHDWAEDPSKIEVYLSRELLEALKDIPAILEQNKLEYAVRMFAVPYTFFQEGEDDQVEWEPPYSLEGGHLKIMKDGTLIAFFPLKHSPKNEIWVDFGTIEDILSLEVEREANAILPIHGEVSERNRSLHDRRDGLFETTQDHEAAFGFSSLSDFGHDIPQNHLKQRNTKQEDGRVES